MTSSEMMYEEYGQMVAEHVERRKKAEVQVNNDIRGNYMDRLGVNRGVEQGQGTPEVNLTN